MISEFIRPLQISGDKPEQLSVKPTFLSKSRSGTPRCRFDSDVSLFKCVTENVCYGTKTSLLQGLMQVGPPAFKKPRHQCSHFLRHLGNMTSGNLTDLFREVAADILVTQHEKWGCENLRLL